MGAALADTIRGYGGRDLIDGKAGADRLLAGRDGRRDTVYGGPGLVTWHSCEEVY